MSGAITVGRYRLGDQLGAGGMGVVYRGFDPELRRAVALKRVRTGGADAKAVRRLRREARAVAQLSHPCITQVYDVIEDAGTLWIVLELIDGVPLTALQRRREVPLADQVRCFLRVSEGLGAAHDRGVLHRDLKHENVLVTAAGEVKILDFGLALRPGATTDSQAGRLAGTVRAMAPEQITGGPLDGRCDLFALGVLIYEAIARRSPFHGDTVPATVHRVLTHRPPSLSELIPETPAALSELVEELLAKSPADRPVDASAVTLRLGEILAEIPAAPGPEAQSTLGASAWEVTGTEGLAETPPPGDDASAPGPASALAPVPAPGTSRSDLKATRRSRWPLPLVLLATLGASAVLEFRQPRGQPMAAASGPVVDVLAPEVFDALLSVRADLLLAQSPEQLRALDGTLRQLERKVPRTLEVLRLRGRVLRRLYDATRDTDDLDRALGLVARARRLAPDEIEPVLLDLEVASALAHKGRVEELLAELAERFPERVGHGQLLRAWALRVKGQPEVALSILRTLAATRGDGATLFELAHLELALGLYDEARNHLAILIRRVPSMVKARALLAQVELLGGDLGRAIELYKSLVAEEGDVESLSNLGVALWLAGRLEDAKEPLLEAARLVPDHPTVQLNAAEGLRYAGDTAAALDRYRTVVELTERPEVSGDWSTWTHRGQALVQLGRAPEAMAALERARALSDRPEVALEGAVILAELGEDDAALEVLQEAIGERGLSAVWLRLPAFDRVRDRWEP
ncbi:MAG: protein kinase [Acidobacteriota bacterium]